MKNKEKVILNADDDAAKLILSGTIRKAYPWEEKDECINAELVRDKLAEVGDKPLEVHINSGGGDAFESIEICNALKAHEGDVKIIVTGRAGSGASIIATAAPVAMYPNTLQMIHKASTIVWGNADALRKEADTLDKVDTAIMASYKQKFVGTEEELDELMAEETWLTAEECITLGLADEIIGNKEDEPEDNTDQKISVKENLLAKYQKDEGANKGSIFNAFNKN